MTILFSKNSHAVPEHPQSLVRKGLQPGEALDGANHLAGVAVLVVARRKRRAGLRPLLQLFGSEAGVPVSDILSRFSANKRVVDATTPPIFVGLLLSSESLSYAWFLKVNERVKN